MATLDYIFVATDSQTGSKIIKGPKTGIDWLVSSTGNWIADEFERNERTLMLEVERYCFKERRMIKTKIFLLTPDWRQMEACPEPMELIPT